jgi:hypothetical protein
MAFGITTFAESPFAATNVENVTFAVTGQELTIQENNVTIRGDVVVSVTGQDLTATLSTDTSIFVGIVLVPTGISMDANLNSVTAGANADVSLSGQALTANLNSIVVDLNQPVDVTGFDLTMQESSIVTVADANLTLSGFDLTMQENSVTVGANADVSLSGQALTANLNSIVVDLNQPVDVTGFDLTMQEGTATAPDSLAILTGLEMTMDQGNVINIIWSEVNTGNAPLDPPGWTEVDTAA